MESPELTIVTDDHTATTYRAVIPAQAGVVISTGSPDDAVERAFAAAVQDPVRVGDLLDALSQGRLWLPLPGDGRPVTDGSAVHLPTVRYLGSSFVPAYTSAARLLQAAEDLPAGQRVSVIPHAVVRAADLARRLPRALGIALNPGAAQSVPIYPPGVAQLAAQRTTIGGSRVTVGPLPAPPTELLAAIAAGLARIPAAREAAAAWLCVERAGEGMIVSVTLDDPGHVSSRESVIAALQDAVTAPQCEAGWPIDVTFPGEGEPDVIDDWIASSATPFYRRSVGLPAPRSPRD
jgi:SseB protein N-terminal domain/SseB protein C-terminal domain